MKEKHKSVDGDARRPSRGGDAGLRCHRILKSDAGPAHAGHGRDRVFTVARRWGFDYGSPSNDEAQLDEMPAVPEGDETQLEEEPAPGDDAARARASLSATLTQLEPVAEEEPDGRIEENDETQLEAPPPPPNDDDDELRFEEADDDDDDSDAAPDAETQLDATAEALPPPVAPAHASPQVLDGAARIAQAQAPGPRVAGARGAAALEGAAVRDRQGRGARLFSFEDDQAEAPAPAPADDEGPIADDRRPTAASSRSPGARRRSSRLLSRLRSCASAAARSTRRLVKLCMSSARPRAGGRSRRRARPSPCRGGPRR